MVTLWVLFVKCRAPEILKEAILCKYSRHQNCSGSTSWHKRIARASDLIEELMNCLGLAAGHSEILGSLACRLQRKFTVAILAQGTRWAVAVTQAFLGLGSISSYAAARTSNGFSLQLSTT